MKRGITAFFRYARARHEIYLMRQAGALRPWTKDPILQQYRFTNVFRELDKTTVWFANNVRTPLRDKPEVLLATVLFRLLNRIEIGEAIFLHDSLLAESSAFYELVRASHSIAAKKRVPTAIKNIERAITAFVGDRGPYVTGAYIISSPRGMAKLPGVLSVVEKFCLKSGWGEIMMEDGWTLEEAWEFFRDQPFLGPFHSYEIVTDLRHTALLENAPDITSWANPGPGARRGLNRVHGRDKRDKSTSREELIAEMRQLLQYSFDPNCWPQNAQHHSEGSWPDWEMREVEHTLCEFDKYERVRLREGRPRGVYR